MIFCRFRRWLHCLVNLHRPVTLYEEMGRHVRFYCECGRTFGGSE